MLAWILAVSSFDKFLTQLTDTVKNVSSAYCRKLVTVSKIKVAHTNTGRLYTSKKELWMLGFGCSVLLLCTYLSLSLAINLLNQFRKSHLLQHHPDYLQVNPPVAETRYSVIKMFDMTLKRRFIENRIRYLFRGCNDLKQLCFKKANRTVHDLKRAYIVGKYFPCYTQSICRTGKCLSIIEAHQIS